MNEMKKKEYYETQKKKKMLKKIFVKEIDRNWETKPYKYRPTLKF